MDDDAQQQAECIDEDVALAPRDLLARIEALRVERSPPFCAPLALWLSITAADGLASRPSRSRTDHESVMQAFEAGADDYLFKPLNPLILKLRIKTGKRLLNLEDELLSIASFDPQTGLINYETFARFFRTHLAGAVKS